MKPGQCDIMSTTALASRKATVPDRGGRIRGFRAVILDVLEQAGRTLERISRCAKFRALSPSSKWLLQFQDAFVTGVER
jgi:hypothetical protein